MNAAAKATFALTLVIAAALWRASTDATLSGGERQRVPNSALKSALFLNSVTNFVATTQDGRNFVVLSRLDGSDGPRVVGSVDGKPRPYPNGAWNGWKAGQDPSTAFVRVNALRIGAEGNRLAPFQGGVSKVEFPVHVYKLKIGAGPPANDHP